MSRWIAAVGFAGALAIPAVHAPAPKPAPCTPSGGLSFVCGIENGEA